MPDIILDTNILSDVLSEYYNGVRYGSLFKINGQLNNRLVRELNKIVVYHTRNDDLRYPGLVTASSYAFVEIARKFSEISCNRYTLLQFAEFIEQPPKWFFISSVDKNLLSYFNKIPSHVYLNNRCLPIEFSDAIHMATAISRDEPWLLAATDSRIKASCLFRNKTI